TSAFRRQGLIGNDQRGFFYGSSYSASPSQGQNQESWPALLQREGRQEQALRRTSEALVLHRRRSRTGMRRRGKSLGTRRGSLPLRALPHALPSQPGRCERHQRGRQRHDIGIRIDSSAEREVVSE